MGVQDADPPALVAEGHKFFAEDFQKARRIGQLQRHADRVPEGTHIFAHCSAGAGFGEFGIVPGNGTGIIAAIGL
jgi:methylthioribose-1-phosphate isomerase